DDRPGGSDRVMVDELFVDDQQVLNDADIGRDQLFNARPQDLDDDLLTSISRPMHLSERGGCKRFLMEFLKNRFQRPFQFTVNAFSQLAGREWRDLIMQLGQFFQVDVWNDVGANSEHLSQLDETRSQRCDPRRQPPRALAVGFIGQRTRRANKNPPPAIPQEREQKRCKAIPYDEDSENHMEFRISEFGNGDVALCPHFQKMGTQGYVPHFPNPKSEISFSAPVWL